jgi:hypothetical protein
VKTVQKRPINKKLYIIGTKIYFEDETKNNDIRWNMDALSGMFNAQHSIVLNLFYFIFY